MYHFNITNNTQFYVGQHKREHTCLNTTQLIKNFTTKILIVNILLNVNSKMLQIHICRTSKTNFYQICFNKIQHLFLTTIFNTISHSYATVN